MTGKDLHWPALPLAAWEPTRATLHMWTQIVGKVRLALTPRGEPLLAISPSWSPRAASPLPPMPYGQGHTLNITFDFISHELVADGVGWRRP